MTSDGQLIARLERLERHVATLAQHLGVDLEDPAKGIDADIVALAPHDPIRAANLYADRTGTDFAEAQRVVDGLR